MRKFLLTFGFLGLFVGPAQAADNYLATQGSGTTFAAKDGGAGLLFPRVIGCDNTTTTQCWTIDSSGRLSALTNPATAANWGIGTSTQNSATVANGVLQLGQFNTAPTTITTGNMSPIQLDSAGNLLVNVKAGGAGGGAVTVADGADSAEGAKADAAWVSGSGSVIALLKNVATAMAAAMPVNVTGTPTAVTGHTVSSNTGMDVNLNSVANTAVAKGGLQIVNGGSYYLTIAASLTAQPLQISTGATGDYLSHCVIHPGTTSPGVVQVFDNTNSAANLVVNFAGGASSVSNLVEISVPVGALSRGGAWKVTTGTNVTVTCYGAFS